MVSWPDRFRLSALNRKLLRDVWEMKGQALAIAAVIAAGVTMYVTYLSNFDSLQRTRAAYYQQQRFGDVFASMARAPQTLAARLAEIPGVELVCTSEADDGSILNVRTKSSRARCSASRTGSFQATGWPPSSTAASAG